MSILQTSFEVPYKTRLLEHGGLLSRPWVWFFRNLWERLYPLGIEKSFPIVNNQASAADITGLKFDKRGVTCAFMEYLIQRVTTGGSAVELTEAGLIIFTYNPTSDNWNTTQSIVDNPDNSGVTFTMASTGQVQYTSSSIAGDASISQLHYRVRTLAGKNSQYSATGKR